MYEQFMRRINVDRELVVTDKETGERVLSPVMRSVLKQFPEKDHVAVVSKLIDYLDTYSGAIKTGHAPNSWEVTQKDPSQVGTVAWVNHMLKKLSDVRLFLVMHR